LQRLDAAGTENLGALFQKCVLERLFFHYVCNSCPRARFSGLHNIKS
jgi:hypothetical protein